MNLFENISKRYKTRKLLFSYCPPWCSIVGATVTVHQFFCILLICGAIYTANMFLLYHVIAISSLLQHDSCLASPDDGSTGLTDPRFPKSDDFLFTAMATMYTENRTLKYILDADLLYCPMESVCKHNRSFIQTNSYISCCTPCSCHESCHYLETCCPDVAYPDVTNESNADFSTIDNRLSCVHSQLMPDSKVNSEYQYEMVSRCAGPVSDEKGQASKERCEKEFVDNVNFSENALDYILPVTIDGISYKNIYCAMCNVDDVSNAVKWTAEVKCYEVSMIWGSSIQNLLENVKKERRCNVLYYPFDVPYEQYPTPCDKGLIRTCNVTGKWQNYDAFIERACESYTHLYRRKYRNVFCFMCNTNDTDFYMQCTPSDKEGEAELFGSFSAIMKYTPEAMDGDVTEEDKTCDSGHVYDSYQVRWYIYAIMDKMGCRICPSSGQKKKHKKQH